MLDTILAPVPFPINEIASEFSLKNASEKRNNPCDAIIVFSCFGELYY